MPSIRRRTPALKAAIRSAKKAMIPETYINRILQYAKQGYYQHRVPDL